MAGTMTRPHALVPTGVAADEVRASQLAEALVSHRRGIGRLFGNGICPAMGGLSALADACAFGARFRMASAALWKATIAWSSAGGSMIADVRGSGRIVRSAMVGGNRRLSSTTSVMKPFSGSDETVLKQRRFSLSIVKDRVSSCWMSCSIRFTANLSGLPFRAWQGREQEDDRGHRGPTCFFQHQHLPGPCC